MFLGSIELELEARFLRSGRRFRSGKRRKTSPSLFGESDYEVELQIDEGYCDEEEEYQLISEAAESEESTETPRLGHDYITPGVLP